MKKINSLFFLFLFVRFFYIEEFGVRYSKIYKIFFLSLFLFSHLSYGIYNLKTKKELDLSKVSEKHWLLLDQNCHSCDSVLLELETFCKKKKPSPQTIGFFVIGFNQASINKKLKSFKAGYEVYVGSPSEFYNGFHIQGSPSLLLKGNKKTIQGKDKIIKKVGKISNFCSL